MNKDILEKAEKINEEKALANEKAYRCICEENTCLQARICPECGGKLDYSFSIQNDPSSKYYKCNECDYEYGEKLQNHYRWDAYRKSERITGVLAAFLMFIFGCCCLGLIVCFGLGILSFI